MMTPMLPVMRQFVRDDPAARRGNIITAARREAAHRADHGLARNRPEILTITLLISSEAITSPPGESTFQDHRLDAAVFGGAVELRLMTSTMLLPDWSAVWPVMMPSTVTTAILFLASLSSKCIRRASGRFRVRGIFQAAIETAVERVRDELREISQQAEREQHDQNDRDNHPAPALARLGRRRRRDDGGGVNGGGAPGKKMSCP
jgi:hypothetical protein